MITINFKDGSTQVVKPSAEHFLVDEKGNRLTPQQLSNKVRDLVHTIAGTNPFETYSSNFNLKQTKHEQ